MNIAQINIAKMKAPLDDPIMADFVNNLDRINTLAEESNGFAWRLVGDDNNATGIKIFEDDFILVNLSVWKSLDDLFGFVYKTSHAEIFKRRKEWFEDMGDMHMALWYVEEGVYPSEQEAKQRLEHLNAYGETPYAFTFRNKFTPTDLANYLSFKEDIK